MAIRTKQVMQKLLGDARSEITSKAGDNKVLSRAEQAQLPRDLKRAADTARANKPAGATVTVNDVVDAYASHVSDVLKVVNTVGPAWVTEAEAQKIEDPSLRKRILDIRLDGVAGPPVATSANLKPFECTIGGSGPEPDFSVFANAPKKFETLVDELGTMYSGNRYNPKWYEVGLNRDNIKAIRREIENQCSDFEREDLAKFEYGAVNKLYDSRSRHCGYEIKFSDDRGIIGGAVYLTRDNKTTSGYDS